MSATPPAGPTIRERIRVLFARINADASGRLQAVTVFVAGALGSALLWAPLGIPSEIIRGVNPLVGDCTAFQPATPEMYVCSIKVGFFTLTGPIATMVVAFVFRKEIAGLVNTYRPRVPDYARFLVTPLLATGLFALSWAGAHFQTGEQLGLLPQTLFPGVIGLFTFAISRWGPSFQARLGPAFDLRDRLPFRARFVAVVLIPMLVSFSLTAEQRVSNTAFKEQVVVIVGLLTGFIVLAPRTGDLMSGIAAQVSRLRARA